MCTRGGADPFIPKGSGAMKVPGLKKLRVANVLLELLIKDEGYSQLDTEQTHTVLTQIQECITGAIRKTEDEARADCDGSCGPPTI